MRNKKKKGLKKKILQKAPEKVGHCKTALVFGMELHICCPYISFSLIIIIFGNFDRFHHITDYTTTSTQFFFLIIFSYTFGQEYLLEVGYAGMIYYFVYS